MAIDWSHKEACDDFLLLPFNVGSAQVARVHLSKSRLDFLDVSHEVTKSSFNSTGDP